MRPRTDPRRLLDANMQLWLGNGAELARLIDPEQREVVTYQPGVPPPTLSAPEHVLGTGPVEGFILKTSRLWP